MRVTHTAGFLRAALGLVVATLVTTTAHAALPAEIHIPGDRVIPESLTAAKDGTIYIGSIVAGTIYRAKPGSDTAEPWIQPGTNGLRSIFGVFADDKSNTLWACSSTFTFGPPAEGAAPAPADLHAFDLKTGAPKGRYPLPTDGAMCNDIAIGSDGTVYATDTNNMQIVRLKSGAKTIEVWSAEGAFGPKGGVLDGISVVKNTVFVNTLVTSKVFSVQIGADDKAGAVAEVKLDRAIERPDGMRSFGKNSLLIIEGGGVGRLSQITLSGNTGKVKTLKEGYPDGPVAVTVVGETGYVLEGQFKAMRPDPNYKPNPYHATAVPVGKAD